MDLDRAPMIVIVLVARGECDAHAADNPFD